MMDLTDEEVRRIVDLVKDRIKMEELEESNEKTDLSDYREVPQHIKEHAADISEFMASKGMEITEVVGALTCLLGALHFLKHISDAQVDMIMENIKTYKVIK